jgi:hypothetical protein
MAKQKKSTKSGVKFTSNLDLVLRTIRGNNEAAAEKAAKIAVEAVQTQILYGYSELHGIPPHTEIVDTGALFDSIEANVTRKSQNVETVSVGTDRPYAKYVHDGYTQPAGLKFQGKDGQWYTTKGGRINGRPFLKDGLDAVQPDLVNAIGTEWKRGF